MSARARIAAVLGAAALLHLVLAWPMPWEGAGALAWLRPTVDFCAILAFTLVCGAPARLRTGAARLCAALVLLGLGARAAVTVMPAFFDVPFRGADLRKLPAVWFLFTHDRPALQVVAWCASIVVGLLAAWIVLSWACRTLLAFGGGGPRRRWYLALALGATAIAAEHIPLAAVQSSSLAPFGRACWHGLLHAPPVDQQRWRDDVARAQAAFDQAGPPLGLRGADVHLLFIESYGREAWRDPEISAAMHGFWQEAGERLQAAGFAGAAAWWAPAVQGTGSHIAHMELLAGVPAATHAHFEAMLALPQRPLPARLRAAGYRTVDAQPAMYVEWPEGRRFYGFDRDVFQAAFGYRGWTYPWGVMPDQFALHWLLEHVVRKAEAPLFLQFISVSSHAPFCAVPPYEPDWSKVDNARFQAGPAQQFELTFLNFKGNSLTPVAYAAAIEYSLRTAVDYALQLERPSLVLMLGDHQPPGVRRARQRQPEPDVPMHALANRAYLIERLLEQGFAPGFVPPPAGTARPMAEFGAVFLRAFAR